MPKRPTSFGISIYEHKFGIVKSFQFFLFRLLRRIFTYGSTKKIIFVKRNVLISDLETTFFLKVYSTIVVLLVLVPHGYDRLKKIEKCAHTNTMDHGP